MATKSPGSSDSSGFRRVNAKRFITWGLIVRIAMPRIISSNACSPLSVRLMRKLWSRRERVLTPRVLCISTVRRCYRGRNCLSNSVRVSCQALPSEKRRYRNAVGEPSRGLLRAGILASEEKANLLPYGSDASPLMQSDHRGHERREPHC